MHSLAKWFHPWHFMHLGGSLFTFLMWHCLLHILRPFVIALFAESALLIVRMTCAISWLGDLLFIDFAHLMLLMVFGSKSLALHISSLCSSSLVSVASGTLNAMMLNVHAQNLDPLPIFSHIFVWLSVFACHTVASLVFISIVVPPFFVLVMDHIRPEGSSNSESILFSLVLSWILSR